MPAVHTAMSIYDISISSCIRCRTNEINWSSGLLHIGRLPDYTCTRCLDSNRLRAHRAAFLATYRKLFKVLPQICLVNIYAFTHPGCHNQWNKTQPLQLQTTQEDNEVLPGRCTMDQQLDPQLISEITTTTAPRPLPEPRRRPHRSLLSDLRLPYMSAMDDPNTQAATVVFNKAHSQ